MNLGEICGIYKITSPSGRVYIGESKDIVIRWKSYKYFYRYKSQTKLFYSFKKYGVENHIFEIIEECNFDDLKCRERYWQDFYNVLNGGLNCILTECGEVKVVYSDELRKKLSDSQIGKTVSEETKKKIGDAHRNKIVSESTRQKISKAQKQLRNEGKGNPPPPPMKGENNPMYGKKHTEEAIKKIKQNKTKKTGQDHPNSNIYLDLETGVYYFSFREIAEVLSMNINAIADRMCGRIKKKDIRIVRV